MTSSTKVLLYLAALVLGLMALMLSPVGLILHALMRSSQPAIIIDYAPSKFSAQTDKPFFYSIGRHELKYGTRIAPEGKTLFSGTNLSVLPSPNGRDAIVRSGGEIWLVPADGAPPKRVAKTKNPYRKPSSRNEAKPAASNEAIFSWFGLQWSSDSKQLYLIRERYYPPPKDAPLRKKYKYSELYKYTLATGKLKRLITPFRAGVSNDYFLVNGVGIFFTGDDAQGHSTLKLYRHGRISTVDAIGTNGYSIGGRRFSYATKPFYTFTTRSFRSHESILLHESVKVRITDENKRVASLYIGGKELLSVRRGKGFKGSYFGLHLRYSTFLPDKRFFLLDIGTGTFSGQLLFDIKTGQYKPLPKETRVYENTNTWNFLHWIITKYGAIKVDRVKKNAAITSRNNIDEQRRASSIQTR